MSEFLSNLASLFGADRYAAHAVCLITDYVLINLFVLFDGLTFLSYFVIGGTLLAHRNEAVRFMRFIFMRPAALALYGAFIVSCGLSHLTMVLTLFWGIYYLDLLVRCIMAVISAGTAILTVVAFYGEEELPSIAEALRGQSHKQS